MYRGDKENLKIAQESAKITMDEYGNKPRVREIVDFCKEMGYQKLGLAYWDGLKNQATKFKEILCYYGFDVIPTSYNIGESNNELPGIDQAKYLNEKETDFNILLGYGVGYDSLFIKYSKSPMTILAVQDRILMHNPLLALYQSDGYLKKKIYTNEYNDKKIVLLNRKDEDDRILTTCNKIVMNKEDVKLRVREIVDFCKEMGYQKLGLAFCVGLKNEAALFKKILDYYSFEVIPIICKLGSFNRSSLDIDEVGVPLCNPIGQAEYLNEKNTDLNILLGLCVGHDTLFIKYSKAPITMLAVKDRLLAHNPMAALYQEDEYIKKKIYTNKYNNWK